MYSFSLLALKISLTIFLVYSFYYMVLKRLTFYQWNRWYFLVFTVVACIIPFIDINSMIQHDSNDQNAVVNLVPSVAAYALQSTDADEHLVDQQWYQPGEIIVWVFLAGLLFLLVRFAIQLISFLQLTQKAKLFGNEEGVKVYQIDQAIVPFSLGNAVFLNKNLHSEAELKDIILHEFVHVRQRHSIDIFWTEILCICNWYNPFVWMLKKAIQQNLEFIADAEVLKTGVDKKQYQYLLVKVVGQETYSMGNAFNISSLKKRIRMMNEGRSSRTNLLRFVFILPLITLLLISFRNISQQDNGDELFNKAAEKTDTIIERMFINDKGYTIKITGKKGNELVEIKDREQKKIATVLLKDWKAETRKYEAMYGMLHKPAPAAKPAPDAMPAKSATPAKDATPAKNAVEPASPPAAPAGKEETAEDIYGQNNDSFVLKDGVEMRSVKAAIKPYMTRQELQSVFKIIEAEGYEVDLKELTYASNGRIEKIYGTITYQNEKKWVARFGSSEFKEIALRMFFDQKNNFYYNETIK